jgi:hypothetical protein
MCKIINFAHGAVVLLAVVLWPDFVPEAESLCDPYSSLFVGWGIGIFSIGSS